MSELKLPSDALAETDYTGLHLSKEVADKAMEVCKAVEMHPDLPTAKPQSLAASAVWLSAMVLNEKRAQQTVAKEFNVSVGAVRNNYRHVAKIVDSMDVFNASLEECYPPEESEDENPGLLRRLFG